VTREEDARGVEKLFDFGGVGNISFTFLLGVSNAASTISRSSSSSARSVKTTLRLVGVGWSTGVKVDFRFNADLVGDENRELEAEDLVGEGVGVGKVEEDRAFSCCRRRVLCSRI
jgi:hypothetical protein